MKNSITEIKNILQGINKLQEAEEWICNLEDRVVQSNQAEENRGKKLKMRLHEGNSVTPSTIATFAYGDPRRRCNRVKRAENLLKEITAESFLNLGMEKEMQIQ